MCWLRNAGQTDKNQTEVKVQITGAYMSIKMLNLNNTGFTDKAAEQQCP